MEWRGQDRHHRARQGHYQGYGQWDKAGESAAGYLHRQGKRSARRTPSGGQTVTFSSSSSSFGLSLAQTYVYTCSMEILSLFWLYNSHLHLHLPWLIG